MIERPDWPTYFISQAYLISTRGTCLRKKVGAILVKDNQPVSAGYNGSPKGAPHCTDEGVGCLIKNIEGRDSCVRTLHAESNALDFAGRDAKGCILYATVTPCYECTKRIINAGIVSVWYHEWYQSQNTELVVDEFRRAGITIRQFAGDLIFPSYPPLSARPNFGVS
jgi:dCMP deaminase